MGVHLERAMSHPTIPWERAGDASAGSPPTLDRETRDALESIVGRDGVVTDRTELDAVSVDVWWVTRYQFHGEDRLPRPQAIAFPRSREEVVSLVKACRERGLPIVPRGGGAGDSGGSLAIRGGIVVDTKRMDRIIAINERSLTVRVQPGIIQRHLEEALNQRGYTMNHLPASINTSTLGGFVSTNGSGILSSKYGKTSDMVQQLEVVLPSGDVFRSLPVNRHSSGPDLSRLFIGAEGTLGIVTEVLAKIHPLPEKRAFMCYLLPDLAQGIEAGRRVMVEGLQPAVMRFYDQKDTEHILRKQYELEGDGCFFLVGFEGRALIVDAQVACAHEIFQETSGRDLGDAYGWTWWEGRLRSYYPPLDYICEPWMTAVTDTVAPYEHIERVYAAMKHAVEDGFADHGAIFHAHFSHWYDWGTAIYPTFLVKAVPEDRAEALELYDRILRAATNAAVDNGGVLNEHHGIGVRLGPLLPAAYGEESFRLLRAIKHALDPDDLMNPGKLGL
jgi:alkyldihydroxyacetonephosphate synthase